MSSLFPFLFTRHREVKTCNDQNQQRRRRQNPGFLRNPLVILQLREHVAQRRQRLSDAEAQYAQICLGQKKDWDQYPELSCENRLPIIVTLLFFGVSCVSNSAIR